MADAASFGTALAWPWGVPFAGLLLSIAVLPSVCPAFWHRHDGKVTAAWSLALLVPFAFVFGIDVAASQALHAFIADYLPFVLLLTALYVVAGGIYVRSDRAGSPKVNAGFLLAGAALASVMGTTGASMVLIRPMLRANAKRRHRTHQVVFFIFIVSNIGGALTPLGDPPLFLGFIQGVDFFWTTVHLAAPTGFLVAALLGLFFLLDTVLWRREAMADAAGDALGARKGFGVEGWPNLVLLVAVTSLVLLSGLWTSSVAIQLGSVSITWAALARDAGLVAVIVASTLITPPDMHVRNEFHWAPMAEVAVLFAGIFVTIVPIVQMLQAGADGPFAPILHHLAGADGQPLKSRYFWSTGLLSSVLDNAPTYLVFFNAAGGEATRLMGPNAAVLAAISGGAVFMGAMTYIGNAPNLMVRSIARSRGVAMPGFFGYMGWSLIVLFPLFLIVGIVWF